MAGLEVSELEVEFSPLQVRISPLQVLQTSLLADLESQGETGLVIISR